MNSEIMRVRRRLQVVGGDDGHEDTGIGLISMNAMRELVFDTIFVLDPLSIKRAERAQPEGPMVVGGTA